MLPKQLQVKISLSQHTIICLPLYDIALIDDVSSQQQKTLKKVLKKISKSTAATPLPPNASGPPKEVKKTRIKATSTKKTKKSTTHNFSTTPDQDTPTITTTKAKSTKTKTRTRATIQSSLLTTTELHGSSVVETTNLTKTNPTAAVSHAKSTKSTSPQSQITIFATNTNFTATKTLSTGTFQIKVTTTAATNRPQRSTSFKPTAPKNNIKKTTFQGLLKSPWHRAYPSAPNQSANIPEKKIISTPATVQKKQTTSNHPSQTTNTSSTINKKQTATFAFKKELCVIAHCDGACVSFIFFLSFLFFLLPILFYILIFIWQNIRKIIWLFFTCIQQEL